MQAHVWTLMWCMSLQSNCFTARFQNIWWIISTLLSHRISFYKKIKFKWMAYNAIASLSFKDHESTKQLLRWVSKHLLTGSFHLCFHSAFPFTRWNLNETEMKLMSVQSNCFAGFQNICWLDHFISKGIFVFTEHPLYKMKLWFICITYLI